jgi:hypothetical protein
MGKTRFETIIGMFTPKFEYLKLLVRELRSALFPNVDENIFMWHIPRSYKDVLSDEPFNQDNRGISHR